MEAGFMKPEIEKTPMKRMATSEEVAESIVYLASPMSSFTTGAELVVVVDGGYSV
jgi:NAD(P)-dependent dehydrogenase (short-subunit alcohol dehydrogenase family)